jgi:hypothetical protein
MAGTPAKRELSPGVCILDTSVFCEIVEVPGRSGSHAELYAEMERKVAAGETLLLPLVAIVETGNHVGQVKDGQARRSAAERFVDATRQAIDGATPFVVTPFHPAREWRKCLDEFVEWATKNAGLADLDIKTEWDRQRDLNPGRRVYVWSLDRHLQGFDTRT